MGYSIGLVAKKTGLSTHTLRYYQKEGLLPFVRKNSAGLRVFTENDLQWIGMIECLKDTGMTLKGIRQYIGWSLEGDATLKKRLDMFQKQEKKLQEQSRQLQTNLKKIRYKIKLYQEAVRLGSLDEASKNTDLKKEKLEIFGHE